MPDHDRIKAKFGRGLSPPDEKLPLHYGGTSSELGADEAPKDTEDWNVREIKIGGGAGVCSVPYVWGPVC